LPHPFIRKDRLKMAYQGQRQMRNRGIPGPRARFFLKWFSSNHFDVFGKMALVFPPKIPDALIIATAIKATNSAYSTVVAPDSPLINFLTRFMVHAPSVWFVSIDKYLILCATKDYVPRALLSALFVKMAEIFSPKLLTAKKIAKAISAKNRAYSTELDPDSSLMNFLICSMSLFSPHVTCLSVWFVSLNEQVNPGLPLTRILLWPTKTIRELTNLWERKT
jgi:hypothetical protein